MNELLSGGWGAVAVNAILIAFFYGRLTQGQADHGRRISRLELIEDERAKLTAEALAAKGGV